MDLFYCLSWLGCIGLGGFKIPVDSFCLLSLLGWGGVKIPADLIRIHRMGRANHSSGFVFS